MKIAGGRLTGCTVRFNGGRRRALVEVVRNAMKNSDDLDAGSVPGGVICCAGCRHFSYFDNKAGHNSPHALGRCAVESWDGSRGQWAMFQHHCGNFEAAATGNK